VGVAEQYWLRVVGFLQAPPPREVLHPAGYYLSANGHGASSLARNAPSASEAPDDPAPREISAGDRLVYFALGPFSLYAVGTATSDPEPHASDPSRRIVEVKTDVFIPTILKTPHLGGVTLPSGRDLRLVVERYQYIWLSPEDGQALVERVHTKAGAKD
jgi:hypothetical protein